MKIFLVGGALRDRFLKLKIKERDWVVVGSNVNKMINLGYIKIGKSFPVFLHPISKEEYALARKEIKINFGHKGFKCFFSKKTKLIEDLYRRDITINAIAEDKFGNIIDPFNGIKDIKNKIIKHISYNFLDDPLRLLRIARFYSYLYHLNFKIKLSTFKLLKKISNSKELKFLSTDRIWAETKKAMLTKNPECYFRLLNSCNSLNQIFPEIYNIFNINKKISIKNIFLNYSIRIKKLKNNYLIKFLSIIYILYDFFLKKKNINKKKILINKNIVNLSFRLNLPNKIKLIIKNLNIYYELNKNLNKFNINKIIKFFNILNFHKNIDNMNYFFNITFINQDRKIIFIDKFNKSYTKIDFLLKIFNLTNSIIIKNIIIDGFNKIHIKKEFLLRQKKIIFSKLL